MRLEDEGLCEFLLYLYSLVVGISPYFHMLSFYRMH